MNVRALSRAEVREIDRRAIEEFGLPSLVLMENAGRGASEWLAEQTKGPVLILCGPGNNGGDGGVMARHLDLKGVPVHLIWLADPARFSPDAAVQHAVLSRARIAQEVWPGSIDRSRLIELLNGADWVVDALFGTGLSRPLEGATREAIELVNTSKRHVLALDVPSGLDAETGEPLGLAIRAKATATFVAPKLGFTKAEASTYTGQVEVFGIGAPRSLLEEFGVVP